MPDSWSTASSPILTSEVYHPFSPSVPDRITVVDGTLLSSIINEVLCHIALKRMESMICLLASRSVSVTISTYTASPGLVGHGAMLFIPIISSGVKSNE